MARKAQLMPPHHVNSSLANSGSVLSSENESRKSSPASEPNDLSLALSSESGSLAGDVGLTGTALSDLLNITMARQLLLMEARFQHSLLAIFTPLANRVDTLSERMETAPAGQEVLRIGNAASDSRNQVSVKVGGGGITLPSTQSSVGQLTLEQCIDIYGDCRTVNSEERMAQGLKQAAQSDSDIEKQDDEDSFIGEDHDALDQFDHEDEAEFLFQRHPTQPHLDTDHDDNRRYLAIKPLTKKQQQAQAKEQERSSREESRQMREEHLEQSIGDLT